MNKEAVIKIQTHTEHLLDHFLYTKEKAAFVLPMISDQETVEKWGLGARARGFTVLFA